jgi:hypothetical protein
LRASVQLSEALLVERKFAEAIQQANLIYPLLARKVGEDQEAVMTLLGNRAASEGSLARWDDAIRDDLKVHQLAVKKFGPVSHLSLGTLSDAGLSQCRSGRYAEGEQNARQAFRAAEHAFGPRSGLTGGCSFALASCLIGANKLQEASALLRNIDVDAVTHLTGDTTVGASIALAQAEIAVRQGDYTLAQNYARQAASEFDRPDSDVWERQSLQKLTKTIDAHLRASK